jgi:hypothetical protein
MLESNESASPLIAARARRVHGRAGALLRPGAGMTTRPRLADLSASKLLDRCEKVVAQLKTKPHVRMSLFATEHSLQLVTEAGANDALKSSMHWKLVGTYDGKCEADMVMADVLTTIGRAA